MKFLLLFLVLLWKKKKSNFVNAFRMKALINWKCFLQNLFEHSKQYKWIFYVYSFQNRFIFVRLYVCLYLFHDKIYVILQIHINGCTGTLFNIHVDISLYWSMFCLKFMIFFYLNFIHSDNIYNQSFIFLSIIYIYWITNNGNKEVKQNLIITITKEIWYWEIAF